MLRASLILLLLAAAGSALPAAASARQPVTEPWATVNVCDTATRPDDMGIRGGMSGLARTSRMYMRFRVQYRNAKGVWRMVKTGADSRWQRVGSGRRGSYDAGWTFRFRPPAAGGAHVLRGVVQFEWRRGKRVVQRDRRTTQAGHPGTAGAEPEDFSAETCEIA
jgi:hypothetical protein